MGTLVGAVYRRLDLTASPNLGRLVELHERDSGRGGPVPLGVVQDEDGGVLYVQALDAGTRTKFVQIAVSAARWAP